MNPLNHFGIKSKFIRDDTKSYNRMGMTRAEAKEVAEQLGLHPYQLSDGSWDVE